MLCDSLCDSEFDEKFGTNSVMLAFETGGHMAQEYGPFMKNKP